MNPERDGLPATKNYTGPDGEEMLLFIGIEAATNHIRKGRVVSAKAYSTYRKLIQRTEGLKAALDHRLEMQGGTDE